jgi:hypothetical protein
LLKRWSEEWIAGHDPERDRPLDQGVVRDGWLGFAPASAGDIVAVETRLGRSLPPSLREFLLVTNGWRDAGNFIYRIAGTAELQWLCDTGDSHWIDAYGGYADEGEVDDGDILARSLRVSLDGDAAVMFLDPDDVDDDGEWAGYWLSSWSGMGPERHGSFYDLMYGQYVRFHRLRKPKGTTREHWDGEVERARAAALAGEVDGPLLVFEEAERFGRERAALLRFQMLAMLSEGSRALPGNIVLYGDERARLFRDPLFAEELLPLLFAEDRFNHSGERDTLERLMRTEPDPVYVLDAEYQARLREPDFRVWFGNQEFDAAVRRIVDRLTADPVFQVPDPARRGPRNVADMQEYARIEAGRRRLTDEAWLELLAAMKLWRPVSADHIAPVVLLAEPVLDLMITPERGRQILSTPRGEGR